MNTATLVKDDLPRFRGHAALYRVDPPMRDDSGGEHKYVVASGVAGPYAVEVMIFAATEDGVVEDWHDLASVRGTTEHESAFETVDYEIVP